MVLDSLHYQFFELGILMTLIREMLFLYFKEHTSDFLSQFWFFRWADRVPKQPASSVGNVSKTLLRQRE